MVKILNLIAQAVIGCMILLVGAILLKYNAQFVNKTPEVRGPASRLWLFQRRQNGRVPILTIISCGWVVIGAVTVFLAAAGYQFELR